LPAHRRGFFQRLAIFLGVFARGNAAGQPGSAATTAKPGSPPAHQEEKPALGGYIRPGTIEWIHRKFDVVVVGGGISGTCAAISAARNGAKTALVHERSMLGGNSSSEIRLFPEDTCGTATWIKESGILEEMTVEERVRNHEPYIEGLMNCHWDLVLYEWAAREPNLTLYLDTSMREVEMRDANHVLGIHAVQLGTEKGYLLEADRFIDATGDGVLGYRAGAEFQWGKEARSTYNEPLAPTEESTALMGNTLFFRARNAGHPVPFRRPDWGVEFPTEADLTSRGHTFIDGGYWWIEVAYPMHPIHDNDQIKHETLRQLLGVWDHIKNKCTHREAATNYGLEFVGFWPYKREARRLIGDYVLKQRDVQNPQVKDDDIAYGCWGIDIHVPGGIHERHTPPYPPPGTDAFWEERGTLPYGIPLRSCYSRNIHNLLMAGRPISASYVAFASSRVLPTGAIVGQAVGAAAALCKKYECTPQILAQQHAKDLQQALLRQDCHIPGIGNEDPADLARQADVKASSDAVLEFPESSTFHPLRFPTAQVFPVSTSHLEAVELLLESKLTAPVTLKLGRRTSNCVWDFRSDNHDAATATATVPAGHRGYVRFSLGAQVRPDTLYYVHLPATPGVSWALYSNEEGNESRIPVGASAADLPGKSLWRTLHQDRIFSMRVLPEQRPYSGVNVVRGTNRPDRWTNFFMSDPAKALPAWVELSLAKRETLQSVQLTFDTNINRRIRHPLFRYPECVKTYDVAIHAGSRWQTVAEVQDNYQRRRSHSFPPVSADRVRINVHATNGSPSARIYEIRLYGASS
jgi:hypothetical protein